MAWIQPHVLAAEFVIPPFQGLFHSPDFTPQAFSHPSTLAEAVLLTPPLSWSSAAPLAHNSICVCYFSLSNGCAQGEEMW